MPTELGAQASAIKLEGFVNNQHCINALTDFKKKWVILVLATRAKERRDALRELGRKLSYTPHNIIVVTISNDPIQVLQNLSSELPDVIFLSDPSAEVIGYYGSVSKGSYILQDDGKLHCIPQRDNIIEDSIEYIEYVIANNIRV